MGSRSSSESKERKRKKDKKSKTSKKHKKKDKHRKRSYSRSRSHRRRSRSRDRERRQSRERQQNRFEAPQSSSAKPTIQELSQQAQITQLAASTPSIIPGMGLDKYQNLLGQASILTQSQQQAQAGPQNDVNAQNIVQKLALVKAQQELATSKADRKIYVGNIPTNITTAILTEVLNQALRQMKINQETPGDSIVGSWISPDQHYSFVEFRTPEEATKGLNALSQADIKLYGQAIKLGRPKQFLQQNAAIEATQSTIPLAGDIVTPSLSTQPLPQQSILNPLLNKINPLGYNCIFDGATSTTCSLRKIQLPTRVLVLKNLFAESELIIDEEFEDIYNDVKLECGKFGNVLNLIFPKPKTEEDPVDITKGHGLVFCRFSTVDEAKEARRGLHGRLYGNRTIECIFLSEEQFSNEDYNILQE